MVYIPSGFWPRVISRLLSGDVLRTAAGFKLGRHDDDDEEDMLSWHHWRTGIELRLFGAPLIVVKEVDGQTAFTCRRRDGGAPLIKGACVPDTNTWQRFRVLESAQCIEVTVGRIRQKPSRAVDRHVKAEPVVSGPAVHDEIDGHDESTDESDVEIDYYYESEGELEQSHGGEETAEDDDDERSVERPSSDAAREEQLAREAAERERANALHSQMPARLLALTTDTIDSLLADWYPGIGERGSHLSTGTAYVTRALLCPLCDDEYLSASDDDPLSLIHRAPDNAPDVIAIASKEQRQASSYSVPCPNDVKHCLSVFLVDQCIMSACAGYWHMHCHRHESVHIAYMAPDAVSGCDVFILSCGILLCG